MSVCLISSSTFSSCVGWKHYTVAADDYVEVDNTRQRRRYRSCGATRGPMGLRPETQHQDTLWFLRAVYGKRRKHLSGVSVVANRCLHVPIASLPTILGHPLPVLVQCANVPHSPKISQIRSPLKPKQCLSFVALQSNPVPVVPAKVVHCYRRSAINRLFQILDSS